MWWVIDVVLMLIAFAISPLIGGIWLLLNILYLVVTMFNNHQQTQREIAQAFLIQQQRQWQEDQNRRLAWEQEQRERWEEEREKRDGQ